MLQLAGITLLGNALPITGTGKGMWANYLSQNRISIHAVTGGAVAGSQKNAKGVKGSPIRGSGQTQKVPLSRF